MTDINILKVYNNAVTDLTRHRPDLTPDQVRTMAVQETADFFQVPIEEVRAEVVTGKHQGGRR